MNGEIVRTLTKAMRNPDKLVVRLVYIDLKLKKTERVVSPIRFGVNDTVLCLCLGREQPRSFNLDGIVSARLEESDQVLMPEPIK